MQIHNDKFGLNVEIHYDETNMKKHKTKNPISKTKNPISIVDKSTLSELDSKKNEYIKLAEYLSTSFANDGSVQIEMTDDGVKTWTI